ncbi:phosphoglycerate mutase [Acidovorax sp. NCPPB 4044]|uniref:phosphoglycerate mutase n=1 Tax=Acidovorax sp. NCPPB 4044 TaxID=2940490 RepID=UPI002304BBC8|nr:phosphoglycerate mutase [Acidovorax sp. NCPPB 4044]MDA8522125.1 phosphoglycerate mutase [Acidovorax sp. NCPPB 4044]
MSEIHHLLIPLAASTAPGARQVLQDLGLPHLDRLLARLSPAGTDAGEESDFTPPHERALARHLGLAAPGDGALPWAAWSRHAQSPGTDEGAAWAWVTPCRWQVGADQVMLADPATLGLDEAASREVLAIVAPWFAEDGIALTYVSPTRWLARGAVFDGLATASLDRVVQRDVRAWMPDAARARLLHRLHSEMQMLLYTHPFNDARAERGLPPVNAFWVHGAGRLPERTPPAISTPHMPTDLRDAALHEDWRAWAQAWRALDAGPVAALADRAAAGGAVRLTLCGERSAMAWESRPLGLVERLRRRLRPVRFADIHPQL